MVGSLYSITECLALTANDSFLSSEAPEGTSCNIDVNSGDCILVCMNGIYDLLPSHEWQPVNAETNLQKWLIAFKDQFCYSDGDAYDNGTVILIPFD